MHRHHPDQCAAIEADIQEGEMSMNTILIAVVAVYKNELEHIKSRLSPSDKAMRHLKPELTNDIQIHLASAETLLYTNMELWIKLIRNYYHHDANGHGSGPSDDKIAHFLTKCSELLKPESLFAPIRSKVLELYKTNIVYHPLPPVDSKKFDHTKWQEYWTRIETEFTAQFENSPSEYLNTTSKADREIYVASQRQDLASRITSREGESKYAFLTKTELPALSEINSHLRNLNSFGEKEFGHA